jgi:hypothetical protein
MPLYSIGTESEARIRRKIIKPYSSAVATLEAKAWVEGLEGDAKPLSMITIRRTSEVRNKRGGETFSTA